MEDLLARLSGFSTVSGWTVAVIVMLTTLQFMRKGNLVPKSFVTQIADQFEDRLDELTKQNDASRAELVKQYESRLTELRSISEARIGEAIRREEYSRGTADIMFKGNGELLTIQHKLADELAATVGRTMRAISPGVGGTTING